DRDIYVEGPIVANIAQTFEAFWAHSLSKKPKVKRYHRRAISGDGKLKLRHRRIKKAWKFFLPDAKAQQFQVSVEQADNGNRALAPTLTCQDMEFVSDRPDPGKASRLFADVFYAQLEQTKQKVLMETPYFITMERDQKILENLLTQGISLELVTNSTNSNNHPMVSNVLNRMIRGWVLKGMKASFMTAHRPPCLYCSEAPVADEKVTYGLHSKSTVIDDKTAMFITFNMDPQSQLRSIEMGLFCHDGPALAQELTKLIEGHKQVSFSFDKDGRPDNGLGLLQGTDPWEKFMYFLRFLPSLMFAQLL
ncbi:MAG: phospholipase D-like domain-containing protein, partial [Bdellovibrionota bacterium]